MSASVDKHGPSFQLDLNADRRKAFLHECNRRLQNARAAQVEQVGKVPGRESAALLAMEVDSLLKDIHQWLVLEAKLQPQDYSRIAIAAQGGYGRGQLNPHSDIDLLILLPDSSRPIEQAFVKSFLYVLWDLHKVELGHATKKISEAVDAVGIDLDSTTALLNLRLVAGSSAALEELARRVDMVVRGSSRRWFVEAKLAEAKTRREKYGSSIYLLEPNVKEGEGGLRDLHSLQWLSHVLLGSGNLKVLQEKGALTEAQFDAIECAQDFLLDVRSALHHAEGRKVDVLSFDKQPVVAAALGYESDSQLLAEEKMMKDYYLHARSIDRYGQKATRVLTTRAQRKWGGLIGAVRKKNVGENFYSKSGELFLKAKAGDLFSTEPSRIMECFRLAAENGLTLSEELKATVERARDLTDTDEFRTSPACREHFMAVMAQKKCAAMAVHAMHETGVLMDYMPEFRRLFCLVRIDHYHKYTVDEHLIKTLEITEELASSPAGDRYELPDVAQSLQRWDLLNLSLLLHDIGKGEGHGHVLRGAIISQKITQRMGLAPDEQEIVRQLILQHLKMVHISQRRDLEDPHVITEMAGTVQDAELLKMLYILTYCDTRAVGPNAWSDWKGSLLYDLYRKTMLTLQGENPISRIDQAAVERMADKMQAVLGNQVHRDEIDRFLASATTKYLSSVSPVRMAKHLQMLARLTPELRVEWDLEEPEHLNYTEITVVAQDVTGLLSWVCGALSFKGVNILSLQAFSTKDGYAIDVLQVTDLRGNKLPHGFRLDRVKTDLNSVILKKKAFSDAFPLRRRPHVQRDDLVALKPAQVIVDNDGSPNYTILEVKAYDRPGLLYDVTSTCSAQGYYIHLAMITTEAYRVVDVFYITDQEFVKLSNIQVKKLREALEAIIT